jgi:phosphomannomutase
MSTPRNLTSSDIAAVFKRDDLRGLWPEQFNAETAFLAGKAMALRLGQQHAAPRVAVGHDARTGSFDLTLSFCRGLAAGGASACRLGLVSSEQVYFVCGKYPQQYQGGAMITASHNPKQYNGAKFIHAGAAPFDADDLAFMLEYMSAELSLPEIIDSSQDFAEHILSIARMPEDCQQLPMRIVVAAGNGVGAEAFRPIAERLAAQKIDTFFLDPEPDGNFPKGVPNPLLPDYMRRLGDAVCQQEADLGIGFDGDADRAGFVDHRGQEIIPSQVLALVARRKLQNAAQKQSGQPRPMIFRNLCCSRLLEDLFPAAGAVELLDTPVGHGKVKLLMRHPSYRQRVLFAGEHSGHYFYPEFFYVDSGMLTSLQLLGYARQLKALGRSLADELQPWRERYCWSGEINFGLPQQSMIFPILERICREQLLAGCRRHEIRVDEAIGLQRVFTSAEPYRPADLPAADLKIDYVDPSGRHGHWLVLRPSGNEPALRLNVEAWGENAAARCQSLCDAVRASIQAQS